MRPYRKFFPLFILSILLAISSVKAQTGGIITSFKCPPESLDAYTNTIQPRVGVTATDIGVSLLALTVSFDIVAIGYIISKLVPTVGVGDWLRAEYWEIAKSAMLIGGIYGIITFMSSIAVALTGNSTGSYVNNIGNLMLNAENYLCNVNSNVTTSLSNIIPALVGLGELQSIRISYGIPIPPIPIIAQPELPVFTSGATFPILSNFLLGSSFVFHGQGVSLYNDALVFLAYPIEVFYLTQIYILPVLMIIGLVVLIPLGLILRALPFVRGIGGSLVAFGLGFAVIWPSILILFNNTASSYLFNFLTVTPTFSGVAVKCGNLLFVSGICNGIAGMLSLNAFTAVSGKAAPPSSPFSLALASINSINPALNLILYYNLYLILQFYLLFILDLMIVYPVTDGLARMLGGSIRFALGRRLKLV